jgi:hypothetical protein
VQIRLSANDYFIARTVADCVTNSTTAITSATAAFEQGDVGRPVTGSSDFQAGTTISAVTDRTHATLSLAATGSHSGQTLALGIMPLATVTANLTTVITRARAQAPLAEIVLAAEYHVGGSSRPYPMSVATYAANWVPAIASVAYLTGCTFLDEYARWGPIGVLTSFADCTLNNGSPIIASSATAQFTQADVGTYVQGANIPPLTTILSVQSTTSATMSANAQGSASGTYKIGSDIHGVSMVDWTHLGDSTNSNSGIDGQRAHGEFVVERTGFGKRIPYAPPAVVQITSTATTTWLCPRTGVYRITCIGGGGSGGGGGSPTNSSATLQVGGAGGGQGSVAVAYMSLTAGTLYTLAVGAGGAQVNGGAGNGSHAGTAGNAGGNTTFTVGSVVVTAYGGGGGPAGGANSTTDILGGTYGGNLTTTFTPVPTAATIGPPGYGGATWSGLHLGLGGGIPVPPGAGGGGAGASASSTLGGLGGLGGAYASAGISGNTATTAGGAGGAGTQPGGGGGGGGGGAGTATSGAGGTGGAGGAGAVLIEKVG